MRLLDDDQIDPVQLGLGGLRRQAFEFVAVDVAHDPTRHRDLLAVALPLGVELRRRDHDGLLGELQALQVPGRAERRDGLAEAHAVGQERRAGLEHAVDERDNAFGLLLRRLQRARRVFGEGRQARHPAHRQTVAVEGRQQRQQVVGRAQAALVTTAIESRAVALPARCLDDPPPSP